PDNAELLTDLNYICKEEYQHFQMLTEVIQEMGADPTAQTPSADVSGVANLGILQVITDPRTTVAHGLEALLTAELTDFACWELLIELVGATGHEKLKAPFSKALAAEQDHTARITRQLKLATLSTA